VIQVKKPPFKKQISQPLSRRFWWKFKITSSSKAKALMQEKTTTVQNYEEFKSVLCDKGGFVEGGMVWATQKSEAKN